MSASRFALAGTNGSTSASFGAGFCLAALLIVGRPSAAFYPNVNAMKGRLFRTAGDALKDADVSEVMEANTVRINRTMAMDTVHDLIASAPEVWPARVHNDPEVPAHIEVR